MKNIKIIYTIFLIFIFNLNIARSQIITTFAGNGVSGFSGDGGLPLPLK